MRLQVAIIRHTLPQVNIVFNTASTPEPVATVADLLSALNSIVPLESSDGEWGLDEYTVEVAANASKDRSYECLHFQLVEDVFKENDEVTVRGLTTDEIRDRRQGGRLQISSDGRRLLDGVAWGRRFRPMSYRPDVIIPPRKRRRIMADEEEEEEKEENLFLNNTGNRMLHLDYPSYDPQPGSHARFAVDEDEEDDEDDDDYVDDHEDDESADDGISDHLKALIHNSVDESEEEEEDIDHAHNRYSISTTAMFDDADLDDEELPATDPDDLANGSRTPKLTDQHGENEMGRGRRRSITTKGRAPSTRRVRFDHPSSSSDEGSPRTAVRIGSYPVESRSNNNIEVKDTSDSNSESEGNSDSEDDESTSSSSSEESDDDSDESLAENTSSSGSDTSSDESDSDDEVLPGKTTLRANGILPQLSTPTQAIAQNPPGSGLRRTKKNNDRIRRRKRLEYLKANGTLSPEADFKALSAYERSLNGQGDIIADHNGITKSIDASTLTLEQKRKELLERIGHFASENGIVEQNNLSSSQLEGSAAGITHHPTDSASSGDADQISAEVTPESSAKRSRLDVVSSRRLLFGSLGLKNPKTTDAEDKLRQRLSDAARKAERKSIRSAASLDSMETGMNDAWKNKLTMSAVECVQEGRILTPPPFPFKQHWERKQTSTYTEITRYADPSEEVLNYDDVVPEGDDNETSEAHQKSAQPESTPSTTNEISASLDVDMPYPADFEVLEVLSQADILPDTVIAYKELHMNARFEPEESGYRVARVLDVHAEHFVVLLSIRDRRDALGSVRFDDEGNRLYHGFELRDEYSDTDDGRRELRLENLIWPKLVKASSLQVPASATNSQSMSAILDPESAVVLESAPLDKLDSLHTDRYISAGSNISGLTDDDELLQPIQLAITQESDRSKTSDAGATKIILNHSETRKDRHNSRSAISTNSEGNDDNDNNDVSSIQSRGSEPSQPPAPLGHGRINGQDTESDQKDHHPGQDDNEDAFTSFHEEDDDLDNNSLTSLKSLPISSQAHETLGTSKDDAPAASAKVAKSLTSSQPESEDYLNARSQQSFGADTNQGVNENEALPATGEISIIPSTPVNGSHNSNGSQESNSQTRSSRRIAQTQLSVSSPAALMMKSALAGLGSRKSLNARKKTRA